MKIIRYLLLAPAGILAVAGISPATAGKTSSRSVTGNVAEACSLSATMITITVKNGSLSSTSPVTVTALCNHLAGGKLTVSATRLTNTGNPTIDYKLTVTGWGPPAIYITAATLPPASTSSASMATSATPIFTVSAVTPAGASGKNYLSTVMLGMSVNP